LIIARNNYFEDIAKNIFKKLPSTDAVLGISYTSLKVFEVAGQRNQKKILFQIDPGLKEEHIVADIVARYGEVYTTHWEPAPATYWNAWRQECAMADVIMANSAWSKDALIEEGIEERKIEVVPLPFQIEKKHYDFKKQYPLGFSNERPLRCLFLGTLTLRKGVHIVLEVAARLVNAPIEFIMVGQNELDMKLLDKLNVKYKGVASRADTDAYYQSSDVFLFPTLSDGFGLTQLEAMAWQLPVIASKHCGEVVVDQVNGLELDICDADTLEKALLTCLGHPEILKKTASNCLETVKQFSLENFADSLAKLTEE
jgi:glycosyltransferase involved in cell wall biosynthesis